MAVLITGHKGFIGQNMIASIPGARGYEWGDGAPDLSGIDRVIHLGAISSTQCQDWQRLMHQNVTFSVELLDACSERRIPFQFASSASVYGADAVTFKETDLATPSTLYALSKHLVEDYILSRDWPMPVQAFRYFNVYGPHEDHKDQPSPHTKFRRQAEETGRIEVFEGSDNIRRDFISVERLIEVQLHFFDLDVSGVYNLGTGAATSFMDVARIVARETGAEIVEVPMPDLRGYQRFTQADMTKTNSLL